MAEKRKLMNVSEAAAARIRQIMENSDRNIAGLRIGVAESGCAGLGYKMDYAEGPGENDEVVEDKGVKLFIDRDAVMFLLGATMDYKTEKMKSGFVFDNPNQIGACGCGESVQLAPASPDALAELDAGK